MPVDDNFVRQFEAAEAIFVREATAKAAAIIDLGICTLQFEEDTTPTAGGALPQRGSEGSVPQSKAPAVAAAKASAKEKAMPPPPIPARRL